MRQWIVKHKRFFLYLIFGVGTTAVSFVSFKLFNVLFGSDWYLLNNALAWVLAVAFAYVTNKQWVFENKSWKPSVLIREIPSFAAARLLSLGIETVGLYLLVDLLGMKRMVFDLLLTTLSGEMTAKLILAVVVVVLNYVFSKWLVFRKK